MSYFIVLLFVLLVGVDLAYLFKRGFGQTAALTNFILIFMLYLGGLFLNLRIAAYVFLICAVLLTGFVGYKVVRNKD
ncbi:MAG: hypothetical protein NC179_04610, partial [[Eubacterium] siraeum]|nr:hypothetical protein [[Eubacterium] siraeum]